MRLIKRYKNRRLYDTVDKKVITLNDLSRMIKNGEEFEVIDNVNKKDITAEILTAILKTEVKSWKDLKGSGNLIRELIAKKGAGAAKIIRKTALASMGAVSLDKKRAEEIIDELIKKGEETGSKRGEDIKKLLVKADEQSKKLLEYSKKVLNKTGEESKKILSKAEKQISLGLERIRKENKEELQELREKISSLEETIKKLEEKL